MSHVTPRSGLAKVVLKQLSHPLKLRFALGASLIVVWQALFFSPLSEQVTATTARIARERKRVATAREVEQLKKALYPHREVAGSDDLGELIRHVMDRLRPSPLRLVDLKPEKPKDLGPFLAIGLKLSLEGAYGEIDEFLRWVESDKRALRVDSIQLTPNTREPGRLSASLLLVALADRATPAVADEVRPRAGAKAGPPARPAANARTPTRPATRPQARPGPSTPAKTPSGTPR